MTTPDKILILEQVQEISKVNMALLDVSKRQGLDESDLLNSAVRKLLDACDIINQLGAL